MPLAPGATVAIFVKPRHPQAPDLLPALSAWLRQRGFHPQLEDTSAPAPPDLAIVLGGDGTMLHVAPRLAAAQTPILAVHLGTLGFLTETALADLYASLEVILAGGGARQQRALLAAQLLRPGAPPQAFEALNEIVVSKGALARIIHVRLEIAGEPVGEYRADGVLVATPTGSTAYSFSAGGPVLHPGVAALIVTPICPHSLSQRPLVVDDRSEIALALHAADEPAYLTIDGQRGIELQPGDRILCRRSALTLTLVAARPRSFYEGLRAKLHWA